jgi:hypothetical protein
LGFVGEPRRLVGGGGELLQPGGCAHRRESQPCTPYARDWPGAGDGSLRQQLLAPKTSSLCSA